MSPPPDNSKELESDVIEKIYQTFSLHKDTKTLKQIPQLGKYFNEAYILKDRRAKQEANAIAQRDLDREAREGEHTRRETIKNIYIKAIVIIAWVLITLSIISAVVLALHCLLPKQWLWLNQDQINTINCHLQWYHWLFNELCKKIY